MRVLVLHSRYLSEHASGENRSVDDEVRLLREAGHTVSVWQPSVTDNRRSQVGRGLSAVWARSAAKTVRRLIGEHSPQVVHCHNLFPSLSPAVLREARGQGVPVLLSLRNHRLICLDGALLRDEAPCTVCVGRLPWRGVVHGCYRDSVLASGALATSLSVHRGVHSFDMVSRFLPVSEFVRDTHARAGFPSERMRIKPNFAWPSAVREGAGDYFLYLGRLSQEKGLATLLPALRESGHRLVVAGTGPDEADLRRAAPPSVEFRGVVDPANVPDLIRAARAVVVPSLCQEAFGRVVVEAYAAGVPVIASRTGGLPEIVEHNESGLLVDGGDRKGWYEAMERLLNDRESEQMGIRAFALWQRRYSPERGLAELEAAYEVALAGTTDGRRG